MRGNSKKNIPHPAPRTPNSHRVFVRKLLAWYRKHGRDLPWRKTRDPYKVLVSEIMLQQTQVDRVLWKYKEFLQKYPTAYSLSRAKPRTIVKDWYPLGYNARPLRLHGMVKEVVEEYGGKFPEEPKELQKFKGIGRYTASAVASFAFGKAVPLVDTNVRRVLHRVFILKGNPKIDRRLDERIWVLAGELIPKPKESLSFVVRHSSLVNDSYDFNQALMDLGATVCTARNPICLSCPMKDFCRSVSLFLKEGAKKIKI